MIKFSQRKWNHSFKKAKTELTHIKLFDNIIPEDIYVKKNIFCLNLYSYTQMKESRYFSLLEFPKARIRSFIRLLEILEERDDYNLKNAVAITLGCDIIDTLEKMKSFKILQEIINFFNKYSCIIIEDHRAFNRREEDLRKKLEKCRKEQKEIAEKIFEIINKGKDLDSLKK